MLLFVFSSIHPAFHVSSAKLHLSLFVKHYGPYISVSRKECKGGRNKNETKSLLVDQQNL